MTTQELDDIIDLHSIILINKIETVCRQQRLANWIKIDLVMAAEKFARQVKASATEKGCMKDKVADSMKEEAS